MPDTTSNMTHESGEENHDVLCRHTARPQWGLALLVWDTGEKRGYQFEDGRLRIIKKGYYELLVEEVLPPEHALGIIETLRRRLGWKDEPVKRASRSRHDVVQLQHQIELFGILYPKRFQGTRWAREKRGIDVPRSLKRHREQAILSAKRFFSKDRLEALITAEKYSLIVDSMREICAETDLVTKAQTSPLMELSESDERDLAKALYELLHNENRLAISFERFVSTLARAGGKSPSWELATVFLALFKPKEHICVRPSTMRKQAMQISSALKVPRVPSAPDYERLRALAEKVRDHHIKAENRPRDLLDIRDFMVVTLTPKSIEQMKTMSHSRLRSTNDDDDKAAA